MKTQLLSLAALSLIAASVAPAFAQVERAPELPDLSEVRQALHDAAAPAAVAAHAVAAKANEAACAVLSLQGATVGRGMFSMTYEVKLGEAVYGTIKEDGGGYAYKDNNGNVAARTTTTKYDWGTKSTVTDCSGKTIGVIQESIGSDSSNFVIEDAAGSPIAQTGWTDSSSISFRTATGEVVAQAKNAHWILDKFQLSLTPKADDRVVVIAGVMNNAAGYRRSAQRRSERAGDGPHGRGDR